MHHFTAETLTIVSITLLHFSNRVDKKKNLFPSSFEDLVLQLVLHWFDSSTAKDIRECMKKTTWRLHSNKKRRVPKGDSEASKKVGITLNIPSRGYTEWNRFIYIFFFPEASTQQLG